MFVLIDSQHRVSGISGDGGNCRWCVYKPIVSSSWREKIHYKIRRFLFLKYFLISLVQVQFMYYSNKPSAVTTTQPRDSVMQLSSD
jgi:hypothetical protein